MDGHEFQIISALASSLLGLAGAVIRYLVRRNEKLEEDINKQNDVLRKNNEALLSAIDAIKSIKSVSPP